MTVEIIQGRMKSYSPKSLQEEENAIKEIYQEIALSALSRTGFFKIGAFQGGTSLRIIHKLNRFSEDLDFTLMHPDKNFVWEPFLKGIEQEFAIYGIRLEVKERSETEGTIQTAFIKNDSFAKIFELSYSRNKSDKQVIKIKFEVDKLPPEGSFFESHYLDFPLPFSVIVQDKASLFAGKCHALLCRPFLKGRDWYDFLWYITNKIKINFQYLKAALIQSGNWPFPINAPLTKDKIISLLENRVRAIDWLKAAEDVRPLLKPIDREMLDGWNQALFLAYVTKLKDYLKGPLQRAVIFRIAAGPAPRLDDQLFSGALTDFDEDEIERINASRTFWCQPLQPIDSLKNTKVYKVIFFHPEAPQRSKTLSGKSKWGVIEPTAYKPGEQYDLPGWVIKEWNGHKSIHDQGIYRIACWFQPVHLADIF